MSKAIKGIFVGVLMALITIVYMQWRFEKAKNRMQQIDVAQQVWSHRGVHDSLPENSLQAIQLAKVEGFKGVEIDVFYDSEYGFVVSHDFPYKTINGKLLNLEEVFSTFGADLFYWLDLKNLTAENKKVVLKSFQDLFRQTPKLKQKVFVESGNGNVLSYLSKELQTIYWVQFSRKPGKQFLKLQYIKFIIGKSNFVGITSDHRYLGKPFKRVFKDCNFFVFTINSKKRIRKLHQQSDIKIILTDLHYDF